jgi:hypothetical protein
MLVRLLLADICSGKKANQPGCLCFLAKSIAERQEEPAFYLLWGVQMSTLACIQYATCTQKTRLCMPGLHQTVGADSLPTNIVGNIVGRAAVVSVSVFTHE